MNLPVTPPVLPMLAKRVGELPEGEGWIFEPKWDGFRALVFRDGDEIFIQSRDEKPLNRYFPELLEPLKAQLPARCVLDGEIVIAARQALDFEALQLRIHPAASRVKLLSQEIPASIVFFDLLCEGDRDLRARAVRASAARALEALLAGADAAAAPHARDRRIARVAADWFRRFEGAGLDGVMAKPVAGAYEPNKRVDAEGEARARVRLRGRRLSLAQAAATGAPSARCCSASTTTPASSTTSASRASFTDAKRRELVGVPRALPRERARRTPVEGVGRLRDEAEARRAAHARAGRAAGARARTCRGSRCAPSWSSRSPTITCRARASATRRSSGAGAPTSRRATAPTRSSRSCRRTSSQTSSPPGGSRAVAPHRG